MIYLRYNLDVSGSVDKRWGSLMTLKVVASKRERMPSWCFWGCPTVFDVQ